MTPSTSGPGVYYLGVDLGTTYSAAAIRRDGRTEVIGLGTRSAVIPSVVLVREHGEVLIGEAAERRAATAPHQAARAFKRRLGDDAPLLLGGVPYSAETLTGMLLTWIVERVAERMGGQPAGIVVTHPAMWTAYRLELLRLAVHQADVGPVSFLSEPEAAAVHDASARPPADGEIMAVYDFGGGTFDTAILRRTGDRFELLGRPEGLERLGGIDIDEAVLHFVDQTLGEVLGEMDPTDPDIRSGLSRLREDCRLAKESLSGDTDTVIPVVLPELTTQVRITRADLEALIAPRIDDTVGALRRAATSADITLEAIDHILLVGGSSRIPLVRQRLRELTSRPVTADADPEQAIAQGAARHAATLAGELITPVAPPLPTPPPPAADPPAVAPPVGPAPPTKRKRWPWIAAAAAVVAAAVAIPLVITSGRTDPGTAAVAQTLPSSPLTSPAPAEPPAEPTVPPTTEALEPLEPTLPTTAPVSSAPPSSAPVSSASVSSASAPPAPTGDPVSLAQAIGAHPDTAVPAVTTVAADPLALIAVDRGDILPLVCDTSSSMRRLMMLGNPGRSLVLQTTVTNTDPTRGTAILAEVTLTTADGTVIGVAVADSISVAYAKTQSLAWCFPVEGVTGPVTLTVTIDSFDGSVNRSSGTTTVQVP